MKRSTAFLLAALAVTVAAGAVWAYPKTQSPLIELDPAKGEARSGACAFVSGGWTIVNCSNAAAASSAALNQWTRYVVQCGDDSYFAPGTAASGQDADASDGWIPSGAWAEFMTTGDVIYYSCLNKNADSDCRHIECR